MLPVIMRPNECDKKAFEQFAKIIPTGAVFLEVGCYAGESAIQFLQSNRIKKYYAVDLWDFLGKEDSTNQANQYNMSIVESWFDERTKPYQHLITKLKMPSQAAYNLIPDNTIDIVYIDANHDYEYVRDDIKYSLPKLKTTGIVSGHDYYMPGVKKATNEFFSKEPDQILEDGSWIYFRKK